MLSLAAIVVLVVFAAQDRDPRRIITASIYGVTLLAMYTASTCSMRARTAFAGDVRKHAEAIRRKYIRPDEGTCDFAFMYVPAEAVYSEMVADGEEKALADACVEMRVFPVSPRLLYVFLSTVAMVLRGEELQKNAREVQERIADLERLWDRAEEPFLKVRGHMNNAQKQYEEAAAALNRFSAKLSGVTEVAQEKLESVAKEADILPLLPPS